MRSTVYACGIAALVILGASVASPAQSNCVSVPGYANGTFWGYVFAGQTYVYQASGCIAIQTGPGYSSAPPDGGLSTNDCAELYQLPGPANSAFPCPGLTAYSLVGNVGGPSCIQLGSNGSFVAPASGALTLYINDENYGDNSGAWDVCITLVPPCLVNSWSSSTRGYWDDGSKWSEGVAPDNTYSVFITNAPGKTVTIDSVTSGESPESMSICSLTLSGDGQSTNILSLADAGLTVPLQILSGLMIGNNSVLRVANSALVVTNCPTFIGYDGTGQVIISNGNVQADAVYVGFLDGSSGMLTMAGGTLTVASLQANSSSTVSFPAGVIHTANTGLGTPLAVGDGTSLATLHLLGGSHSFGSLLSISSNAQLTGCGTITSPVVNNGTMLLDCAGGIATFSSIVTNNGAILATNGAALMFGTTIVNNGTIDASSGSVWFGANLINHGTVLPTPPPASPSGLVATMVYSDLRRVDLTWQDNANNESVFLVERATNTSSFLQIATLPVNSTNYTDATFSTNVTAMPISYRIRAINSVGYSAYSNIATAGFWTATNSWVNPGNGAWQVSTNWSLSQSPANNHTILITNDNKKAVTINSTTAAGFSNTLTVSDLVLSAPDGSTNILDLSSGGSIANRPLRVLHTFQISSGGSLRVTNSAVSVDGLVDGAFAVDGNAVLYSKSLVVAESLYAGLDTNATGSILLSAGPYEEGGRLLLTNLHPSAIGVNGSGQLIVSNGTVQTAPGFFFVGSGSGSHGALTVAATNNFYPALLSHFVIPPYGRLVVGMETGAVGAVRVGLGGELVTSNSFVTLIGYEGSGELSLSNGTGYYNTNVTSILGPVEVGGNSGSRGALTVAGGTNYIQGPFIIGASIGATGTAWVTGGKLITTNWPTCVGSWGDGVVTVSNGHWSGQSMLLGLHAVPSRVYTNPMNPQITFFPAWQSHGTLNVNGGSITLSSKLIVGNCPSGGVGVVNVTGGSLYVTNPAHNAVMDVSAGNVTLDAGLMVIDNLVLTNACGHFQRTGGTLQVNNLLLDPGLSATGDGLPNVWKQTYGLDPFSSSGNNGPDGDPDGDGISNLEEYLSGTDPTDPTSGLRITSIAQEGDDIRVTWTTVGGKTYALQGITDIGGGSSNVFVDLATIVMPDGGESTTNYLDVGGATNTPSRFYRVRLVPPTGLWVGFCGATNVPFNRITVTWSDDNSNEDGYKIERATSAGGPWTQIAQVPATTHSYRDIGAFPNTTYYYRVRAYNAQGNSPFSNVASAGVPALCPGSVVGWGASTYGEATPPTDLTGVVAIAAGYRYSLALKSDGTVVGWGYNSSGQATPPTNLTGVVAIAAGDYHGLALKSDGTVVGWGRNNYGQATPPTNLVVAIAAGAYHSLGLKSDGTVIGWGGSAYGEASPPTNLTGVVAIAAGGSHSLALKSDGTVVGWGDNNYGETNSPAGLSGVVAVAAGEGYSLALRGNGTVVGWSNNFAGAATSPTNLTGVVDIAAGTDHSLALKSDGTVVGWGSGQTNSPAGLTGVVAIAAGSYHSLALTLAPSGPSALTTTVISTNQINLSWTDNSDNEDRFGVERSISFGPWTEIASVNAGVTAYSDTGVACGQWYTYRIRAYNACAGSPYSSAVSANTSSADADCDGIPDAWMLQYFGHTAGQESDHSRAADDADADGFTNLQEYLAGTDPTNSASAFRIVEVAAEDDDVLITWTVVGGKRYVLQTTTGSSGGFSNNFVDLNPAFIAPGTNETVMTVLHLGAATDSPARFYRVRLVP